jgi:hypothetical protein
MIRFCVDVSNVVQSLTIGMKKYVAPASVISVLLVILLKRTPTCVAPVVCGVQAARALSATSAMRMRFMLTSQWFDDRRPRSVGSSLM